MYEVHSCKRESKIQKNYIHPCGMFHKNDFQYSMVFSWTRKHLSMHRHFQSDMIDDTLFFRSLQKRRKQKAKFFIRNRKHRIFLNNSFDRALMKSTIAMHQDAEKYSPIWTSFMQTALWTDAWLYGFIWPAGVPHST